MKLKFVVGLEFAGGFETLVLPHSYAHMFKLSVPMKPRASTKSSPFAPFSIV